MQKASGTFHRAVLVLPLTPEFDPPRGQPGHGRVQFSDRVSASASVGKELTRRALEVPWHFKLEPLARNADEELVEALGFDAELDMLLGYCFVVSLELTYDTDCKRLLEYRG